MKEADLRRAVEDYLQIQMNLGRLYWDRLNSGEIIAIVGDRRRRIKLCRPGTADFIVIRKVSIGDLLGTLGEIIFIETKGKGTRFTPEQQEFAEAVIGHGADYYLIESIEELERILPLGIVDSTQTT